MTVQVLLNPGDKVRAAHPNVLLAKVQNATDPDVLVHSVVTSDAGWSVTRNVASAAVALFTIEEQHATVSAPALFVKSASGFSSALRIQAAGPALELFDGTNSISFFTPVLTGSSAYYLPAADGSSGQFMKTDGSGTLSWAAPDHGALSGLADDDHTQYLALAGRAGGQTLTGVALDDTAALTITRSVSHSSNPTVVIEQSDAFAAGAALKVRNTASGGVDLLLVGYDGFGIGFKNRVISADLVFTLPATDGLASYPLITNGSATLSFGSITGAAVSGNIAGSAANVTGTVAIANGGTGQTGAQAAFDALSPVTTAGDLIIRGASNNDRLAIGSTGQVLTVVAGAPAWAAAGFTSGASVTSVANEDNLTQTNNGTGHAHYINQAGVLAVNKQALRIYSNAAQVNSPLVAIHQDNASSTANVNACVNDGTGLMYSLTSTATYSGTIGHTIDVNENGALGSSWGSSVRITAGNASSVDNTACLVLSNGSGTTANLTLPLMLANSSTKCADVRVWVSRSTRPDGPNNIGDLAFYSGKWYACTVAGSPGTWVAMY